MATVEERNAELTKQLSLLKERNKQLGNIVDVEKDIVIKSKEIQPAADGVKQQYESVRESVFSGIESFTTGMFGGPIGGLINTLTIGSLKRRKENAKIEKEKAKEEAKKTAEENALRVKSLNVMAETLLQTDEYAGQTKEQVIEAIKARELQIEQNTLNEQIKNEKERALAFFKDENDAAEANGGEVSSSDKSIEVSAVESGGEVSSSPELGLIFDAVVESGEKIDISNKHLKVIADGVPTAEELEEAKKKGAAAAGGEVAEPKKEEKDGFIIIDMGS